MNVYLVRHGAYGFEAPSDRGPALSAYGREQAAAVGQWLATQPCTLTHLITSPYLRAQQTAAEIQAQLNTTLEPLELMEFSPSGEASMMQTIVESIAGEALLVVGHMCSIGTLARALCASAPTSFSTGMMVALEGEPGAWRVREIFRP